jgi:cysteine desulfurase/selenocysteine lyase
MSTATRPLRPAASGYDVERIRRDFPILSRRVHGKPLVYLDNAATTHKPSAVIETTKSFYEHSYANIHRGVHTLSVEASDAYEMAREKARAFINAAESREIVFVRGTTEGINLVAQTYGRSKVGRGDEVVISALEHHSNIVPWRSCAKRRARSAGRADRRARTDPPGRAGEAPFGEDAHPGVSHLQRARHRQPRRPDRRDGACARRPGPRGRRAGGAADPGGRAGLDADFYRSRGTRCTPTGVGVLYAKAKLLEEMPPYQGGGDMISSVTFEKTTYNILPFKFEAGTPNIAGGIGLAAAMDYLSSIGMDAVEAHEDDLLSYATERLSAIPGLTIVGTAENKAAVLSFTLEGVHPHDIGTVLDREGIAVRTGHHCAQPVMDRFGLPATARASFGLYNTRGEVDALVAAESTRSLDVPPMSPCSILGRPLPGHPRPPKARGTSMPAGPTTAEAEGYNPLCGDRETVYLTSKATASRTSAFQGAGARSRRASASMMTERTGNDQEGRRVALRALPRADHGSRAAGRRRPGAGEVEVFSESASIPSGSCATLPWHTLKAALNGEAKTVSTELSEGPPAESGGA